MGFNTTKCDVLYLALEDTFQRVKDRIARLTDETPTNLRFAVQSGTLGGTLEEQLTLHKEKYPETKLMIIDTLQKVRGAPDAKHNISAYSKDYPPRAERFEGSAYTEEELALLIEKTWNHKLGLLIYVTALLGLRRSEVLGLRWKAIDFEENKITINHTVTDARIDGKTVVIAADRTKTKSSYRSFPMSETVRKKLLAWREVQQQNRKICGNCYNMDDIDYVFTDEMGNRFKPRYIEDAFPKLLKKHGLRKIRFHDLRHTCATLMHKMGLSPKEVQDYLGHSTVSVTLNIYTHLDWSIKENAAKVMEHAVKLPENMQISNPWKA